VNVGLGSTNAPLGLRNASSPLAGLVGAAAFGTSVAAAWKGNNRMRSGLRAFSAVALTILYLGQMKA
jgi:hypothetical protein